MTRKIKKFSYQLVHATMKVERSKARSKERFQKKKFSRGPSSSLGKIAKEFQDESVQGSATTSRR